MLEGNSKVPPRTSSVPGSDEAFQALLLRIAAQAADRSDVASLIHLFCHAAREVFQVSGDYFGRRESEDQLVGEEADGKMAEHFQGLRLKQHESAVTMEAVRRRRAVFVNQLDATKYSSASEFGARSLMAVPLVVFHEVIGATTFLHDSDEEFFNADLVAKATILAGQLGSLLEASRLSEASGEDHRRAELLADVAQALHGTPDVTAVIEALADKLRVLLRSRLVCVLLRRDGPFELRAVSAETPQLAHSARARHDRQTIRFAADLAQRAVAAGEPVTLSVSADVHSLGSLVSAGMLIAAPFRTSQTQGAILVYPRSEGVFTAEEKSLVAAIAGFGAVAVAHAELYAPSHAQAHEWHQLLEISSALSSSGDLEQFLQAFVVRAADFLGFGRCFIALLEQEQFHVRYGVEKGEAKRVDEIFPEGIATHAVRAREVFCSDDASALTNANLDLIARFHVRQVLIVPLLGAGDQIRGAFGVLDRLEGARILPEDVRRARALSAQVAVVLEVARNLHQSQQHRRQAEVLMDLAREIDGVLHLPDFARKFVQRVVDLTGANAGAFALFQDGILQTIAIHPPLETPQRPDEPSENTALSQDRHRQDRPG